MSYSWLCSKVGRRDKTLDDGSQKRKGLKQSAYEVGLTNALHWVTDDSP